MIKTRILRACSALLAAAFLVALAPTSHAVVTTLFYKVTLNVASLDSNADAPFSLDLQLISGSGNVTNSVAIGLFQFTGGTLTGTPTTVGVESGSTNSFVALTVSPTTGFSEFAQQFSNTMTQISFVVEQTTNSEVVGTGTPTPDAFEVSVDDNNTSDGFVPTNSPNGTDALAISNIAANEVFTQVGAFNSTASPDPGVATAVAVPEPGSAGLLLLGAVGLVVRRKRTVATQAI